MPALRFPTVPVCPAGDDVEAVSPQAEASATGQIKRESLPATAAAEQLPRKRVPHRPGAITPRTPLINALASARSAARTPSAAMPHPDASHHVETQDPPQTRSHAISAALTVSSTLDQDICERPDTLALPQFPTLTTDLRRPDERAMAELEAASRLRKSS